MRNFLKTLLIVGVGLFVGPSYAGLADDVRNAYANGDQVRPIIDGYIQSPDFSLDEFVAELAGMPVNAPAAIVYLVEHDAKRAQDVVAALLDSDVDTLVVAVVLAAKGKSPSMCPMVKAMARQDKGSATEAVVAVSTEAPSQASQAVECARSEGLDVDLNVGADEASDFELELQLGGGDDDAEPPISPN